MRVATWIMSAWFVALPCAAADGADGNGLTPKPERLNWSGWQSRASLAVDVPVLRTDFGAAPAAGLQVRSISLMRDYYLTGPLLGSGVQGGLHTTGGLIIAPGGRRPGGAAGLTTIERRTAGRGAATLGSEAPSDSSTTIPYVGVGYVGQSNKGRWSFSADFGLMALAAGNVVRFGGVFNGSQSLDGVARDMRFSPVMQMGLSYSF